MTLWEARPVRIGCCCCAATVLIAGMALMGAGRQIVKAGLISDWLAKRIGQLIYDIGGCMVESIIGERGL